MSSTINSVLETPSGNGVSYSNDILFLCKLQKYLEKHYSGCDIIPLRVEDKRKSPKYSHKNGVWTSEKARAHTLECEDRAGILLNEKLIVIDIDSHEYALMIECMIPVFKETVQVMTSKGKHYYFNRTDACGYPPGLKDSSFFIRDGARSLYDPKYHESDPLPIDIKTLTTGLGDKNHPNQVYTRGLIEIPPSPGKIWVNALGDHSPLDMPEEFVEFYKAHYRPKPPARKVVPKPFLTGPRISEEDKISRLVALLSDVRASNYPDWIAVGWALKHIGEYLALWVAFSKRCLEKYEEGECEDLWEEMDAMCVGGHREGSLHYWARQDNPDGYSKLMIEMRDYRYLTLNDVMNENILYDYDTLKSIFNKSVYVVKSPAIYIDDSDGKKEPVNAKDLKTYYDELKYIDNSGPQEFLSRWFKDKKTKFDSIGFLPPPMPCGSNILNQWEGFAIDKHTVSSSGNVTPFKHYISILCNHDPRAITYFTNWLAHIVQFPGLLCETAIVFHSSQGAGKNRFLERFAMIIGNEYYTSTTNPQDDLISKHATGRYKKLLVSINESNTKTCYANNDRLKGFITDKTFKYEAKNIMQIDADNFARYVFTTNNLTSVKVEEGDRRFAMISCSNEKCNDRPYFKAFDDYIFDLSNQKAVIECLRSIDLSVYDWVGERPMSSLYKLSKYVALDNIIKYIEHYITEVNTSDFFKVQASSFQAYWDSWVSLNKLHDERSWTTVKTTLINYCDKYKDVNGGEWFIKSGRDNKGVYYEFSRKNCIKFLTDKGVFID